MDTVCKYHSQLLHQLPYELPYADNMPRERTPIYLFLDREQCSVQLYQQVSHFPVLELQQLRHYTNH